MHMRWYDVTAMHRVLHALCICTLDSGYACSRNRSPSMFAFSVYAACSSGTHVGTIVCTMDKYLCCLRLFGTVQG